MIVSTPPLVAGKKLPWKRALWVLMLSSYPLEQVMRRVWTPSALPAGGAGCI